MDEIYTKPQEHKIKVLEREKTIIIAIAILLAVLLIFASVCAYITWTRCKYIEQENGADVIVSSDLTINKTENRNLILEYNGRTYYPEKIQFKEGIVFWYLNKNIYCADRTQVRISILSTIDNE